jgi:7-cyano-7-deazaguanine synthase in queuosine biosynthesis
VDCSALARLQIPTLSFKTMKILILFSGGLDSLIMKRYAEVNYPDAEVVCAFYDIGQEYNHKEVAALPPFVEQLTLDWLTPNVEAQSKDGSDSGNIYIPGRNLVLAVAAACKYLPDQVWLGALLGEVHESATDKNWKFLDQASDTLSYVLSPFKPNGVQVKFPLANAGFNKLTATKWALDNGVPVEAILKSSSCLSGEHGNCGKCVVCFRRWGIFKQLGIPEEQYNVHPLESTENELIAAEMLLGTYYDEHRIQEIVPALPDWYKEKVIEKYRTK